MTVTNVAEVTALSWDTVRGLIQAHWTRILNWRAYPINNGKMEGTNNDI